MFDRVLMETREMLEEQLQSSRKRSEHVLDLENELIKCKKQINEMSLVCDIFLCLFFLSLY